MLILHKDNICINCLCQENFEKKLMFFYFGGIFVSENFNYAVIGHPISHTMSPFIHNKLFEISSVDGKYGIMDIEPEKLGDSFEKIKSLKGCNFTIPHKSLVIPLLDEIDDGAALYGAVNTVKFGEKSKGYNTDCLGFLKALEGAKIDLSGNVIVCGNGGASRMMAFESAKRGCTITIAVRNSGVEKGEAIKQEIISAYPSSKVKVSLYEDINEDFDLLLNGTPLGMYPKFDGIAVNDNILKKCSAVFDCIYNPKDTLLIKKARANGSKAESGMAMLVWQAAKAQTIWNGYDFTHSQVEPLIEQANYEMERLFR